MLERVSKPTAMIVNRIMRESVTTKAKPLGLLGICFWREAPETAVGASRRAEKRGVILNVFMMSCLPYTELLHHCGSRRP